MVIIGHAKGSLDGWKCLTERAAARASVEPQNSGGVGGVVLRLHEPVVQLGGGDVQVAGELARGELSRPAGQKEDLVRQIGRVGARRKGGRKGREKQHGSVRYDCEDWIRQKRSTLVLGSHVALPT
jgi:hypothetical protein